MEMNLMLCEEWPYLSRHLERAFHCGADGQHPGGEYIGIHTCYLQTQLYQVLLECLMHH